VKPSPAPSRARTISVDPPAVVVSAACPAWFSPSSHHCVALLLAQNHTWIAASRPRIRQEYIVKVVESFDVPGRTSSWYHREPDNEVHGDYAHWQGVGEANGLVVADDRLPVRGVELTLRAVLHEVGHHPGLPGERHTGEVVEHPVAAKVVLHVMRLGEDGLHHGVWHAEEPHSFGANVIQEAVHKGEQYAHA